MKTQSMLVSIIIVCMALVSYTSAQWAEQAKLKALDAPAGNQFRFGWSASISGNYAIVGSLRDTDSKDLFNVDWSGSVYIFERDGAKWIGRDRLTSFDGHNYDHFGDSVSINGDYAIVGAFSGNNKPGSAYIFKRADTKWTPQAKITASDSSANDWFGKSVSISGSYAIVGAVGSAYIFKLENTNWIQHTKLTIPNSKAIRFGDSVAISGNHAIVGAVGNNDLSGAAYIFESNETGWIKQAELKAHDNHKYAGFGHSVSINGNYAIVGAPGSDGNEDKSGCAYIFKLSEGKWTQQAKLIASDGSTGDEFGNSVSISGDCAIVGSMGDNHASGSAYIFKLENKNWVQKAKLADPVSEAGNSFGNSVCISGNYAVVGARADDTLSGSAYIYLFKHGAEIGSTSQSSQSSTQKSVK